jgi:hypothetical protein
MTVELTPSSPPARTPRRQRPTPVPSRRRGRPPRWTAARALAAALVILAVGGAGLAWSDDAVNVTFHVGAQGQTNPGFPAEIVNLKRSVSFEPGAIALATTFGDLRLRPRTHVPHGRATEPVTKVLGHGCEGLTRLLDDHATTLSPSATQGKEAA